MNEQAIERLLEALSPLAEKLGETASFVFEAALKESLITGVTNVFWSLVFFGLSGVAVYVGRRFRRNISDGKSFDELAGYDQDDYFFASLLTGIVALVFAVPAAALLSSAAHHLFNPEYQALRMLLSEVTG